MRIKFTRVLYVEDEVDIPLKAIEKDYDGDIEEALKAKYIVSENCKIKDVVFEDIEEGKLDEEDTAYLKRIDEEAEEDERIIRDQYYKGLM
ncbi:Uncharacterised protein [Anaerococcus prevotii]|uniref:Uncharacterized protein n=1 Tax=Anaerococcus prevotii (strain ATCC 9321 / DSM 20548 / JCM 6508 / NCTC 11806 / PC1) TaxID=525919 RepID=C7RH69_ANAPD|nr:hypothetical protein [Anaerococcus prevotii]ACV28830.1 hypothetical protein Apre_0802 [Anaerococcus prevotii DSM 20548]SUU94505.1 Uncharacterised protein [Anaerococcus prevotii]